MAESDIPAEVKFDYLKAHAFRVVHADGVFGGPTPNRLIAMTLFSERLPIPQQTVHAFKGDGMLGEEIIDRRVSRDAVVRELEVCVMLSVETATRLHEWLAGHIEQIKRVTALAEKKSATPQ